MLDPIWTNFNYLENWDPGFSSNTKTYDLTIDGTPRSLVLDTTSTGSNPFTDITTGFYPQLIDDFNVFLQGLKLFSGQTQVTGNCTIQNVSGNCSTFVLSGNCTPSGSTITINNITNTLLKTGYTINLPQFNINLVITGQLNGVNGGTGTYTITPSFSSVTQNFTGPSFVNITQTSLNSISNGLILTGSSLPNPITILNQISGTTNGIGLYNITASSATTSNFIALNPLLQVNSVDTNVISSGSILNGLSLNGNVNVISQVSGTTGGIGLYIIGSGQTSTTSPFVVQNAFIAGIGSSSIQPLLDDKKLIMS
jgi:hypothetical protein